MSYKYSLYRTNIPEGKNQCSVFGIEVYGDDGAVISRYKDISPNREDVVKLISLLGDEEIESEQLNYIIEDYVTLIFTLEY